MIINLNSIVESRNTNIHLLSKAINCDYHNLLKISRGETLSISFDVLERICIALDCSPADILLIERDKFPQQKEPS